MKQNDMKIQAGGQAIQDDELELVTGGKRLDPTTPPPSLTPPTPPEPNSEQFILGSGPLETKSADTNPPKLLI